MILGFNYFFAKGLPDSSVSKIFEETNRIQKMLDVESALAYAHAAVGTITWEDADTIASKASLEFVKLTRIKEIERETKHKVMRKD